MFFRPSISPETTRRNPRPQLLLQSLVTFLTNIYQTVDSCQSLRDTQRRFETSPLNSARSPEPIYSTRLPNLWLNQNRPTSKHIKHRSLSTYRTVITNKMCNPRVLTQWAHRESGHSPLFSLDSKRLVARLSNGVSLGQC